MNVDLSYIGGVREIEHDCKNFHHIPHQIPHTSRTIAIGDIHGDLNVAIKMLEIAKCIKKVKNNKKHDAITLINKLGKEEYYIWIGNDTIVVQVGDQVDRCRPVGDNVCIFPQSTFDDEASDIKILKFYTDMNELAIKDGGHLISLLGNHELMNVMGNMKYVSYKGLEEFVSDKVDLADINQGMDNRKIAFSSEKTVEEKKKLLKNVHSAFINNYPLNEYLACTRLSGIIVGNILFVHGGMVKKLAESYKLDDLNKIVRKWLLGKLTDEIEAKELLTTINEHNHDKIPVFDIKTRIKQLLTSDQSVFWNRVLAYIPDDATIETCDKYLNGVFDVYDVKGIIIGHTPHMKGISSSCNNRIWKVDIGASNAFHNFRDDQKIEVLEITYDKDDNAIFTILE